MSSIQTRLRLYALIVAVENDIRRQIIEHIVPSKSMEEIFSTETIGQLVDRARADDSPYDRADSLIHFTQLPDVIHAMVKFSHYLGDKTSRQLKSLAPDLNKLVPIRNRVMHSRPLKFDDYFYTSEFCQKLAKTNLLLWRDVSEAFAKIDNDPSFLLTLSIPVPENNSEKVLHNLPAPDFDDTGFIGREETLAQITDAIKGPYPVVTITGEGGLGKTAVALKSCYDLIDAGDCPFDAIIWTSAKTTMLTTHEIVAITDAVQTSVGIFEAAATALDLGSYHQSALGNLLAQLREFRILLIIDNLETVLDENVRRLVREVPSGSKILFTSRVSIGAFDYPIPLPPLSASEAQVYFRALSKFWGLSEFAKLPAPQLTAYIRKLHCNPLFIKWFIQAVSRGENPNRILMNPKLILEFCLSHVIQNLTSSATQVLETLVFLADTRTASVLSIFCDLKIFDVERSLNELISSNLVDIVNYSDQGRDQHYQATELAKFYIRSFVKRPLVDQSQLIKKKKELATTREILMALQSRTDYDMGRICIRGEEDIPAAKLLVECQAFIKSKNWELARAAAEHAIEISPTYFEGHRCLASVLTLLEFLMQAQDSYESAVSLNPLYAPLRLWYGDFLLTKMDDPEGAEVHYNEALVNEPDAPEILVAIVRLHMIKRDYKAAFDLIEALETRSDLNPRLRRRLVAYKFQSMLRNIEQLAAVGEFDSAYTCLLNLRKVYTQTSKGDIDHRTKRKVSYFDAAVRKIVQFFKGTPREEEAERYKVWFDLAFEVASGDFNRMRASSLDTAGGADVSTAADAFFIEGDQCSGVISKLLKGYGFITCQGRSIFFPFANWRPSNNPIEDDIGADVTFTVCKNHKGFFADEVLLLKNLKDPELSDLVMQDSSSLEPIRQLEVDLAEGQACEGILTKVLNGFGFIEIFGREIFFPFNNWEGSTRPTDKEIGAKVTFYVGKNHVGPCAERVKISDVGILTSEQGARDNEQVLREDIVLDACEDHRGIISKVLKGFGFINCGGQSIFFSSKNWHGSAPLSQEDIGTRIIFELGENHQGTCAVNVRPA